MRRFCAQRDPGTVEDGDRGSESGQGRPARDGDGHILRIAKRTGLIAPTPLVTVSY